MDNQKKPALSRRVAICLVEPIKAGNVGSVARAMKNMGLRRLILVNPPDLNDPECRKMGVGAMDIVEGATIVSSLREAVAPFSIMVSTTRRLGRNRTADFSPKTFASFFMERIHDSETVICFGREDKGLSTHEIDLAPWILSIPTDAAYESMNLAQAVMVVAYELYNAVVGDRESPPREPAESGQIEGFFDQAYPLLLESGFLPVQNPEWIMRALRRILHRAQLEWRDIKILRGICSDMEWYLDHVAKVGKRDGLRSLPQQ